VPTHRITELLICVAKNTSVSGVDTPGTNDSHKTRIFQAGVKRSTGPSHAVTPQDTRVYPKVSGLAAWGRQLQMVQLSATRYSCIAIL
jgi:hypothetical protein